MRGLQVNLVMSFTSNAFGGRVPTVGIAGPSSDEMPQAIAEMAKRRGMSSLDMDKAMSVLAQLTSEELAAVDADYLYENFYLGEHQALPAGQHALALPAPKERLEVAFGSQDPYVSALISKCRLSYAAVTQMQMRHGADVRAYIDELTAYAEKYNIDITRVLAQSSLPSDCAATQSEPAPAPSEPAEPEFTEVDDEVDQPAEGDKDDLFANLKAQFDVRKDS